MQRIHLRRRVLLLTAGFASALLAITFGLTWSAKRSQERWKHIAVEMKAIAAFDQIIRQQNAFVSQLAPEDPAAAERYRGVEQLLEARVLQDVDTRVLRERIAAFRESIAAVPPGGGVTAETLRESKRDLAADSARVTLEAKKQIEIRQFEVERQAALLERGADWLIISGTAVAWIVIIISFAVAKLTLHKVVRPIESLSEAASRIANGELSARAPIGGDRELLDLGTAINDMADKLRQHARTDDLTLLPNFRAFRERIDEEIQRASRYEQSFGVLVLDLDHFKNYNDEFGHLAGNEALQRVAAAMREALRTVDSPARYGGEEFAVIVPQIDRMSLERIAERIRAGVAAIEAPPEGGKVTVSIGGAIYPVDGISAEKLFHAADERLYTAKRDGRNRVVIATAAPAVQSAG